MTLTAAQPPRPAPPPRFCPEQPESTNGVPSVLQLTVLASLLREGLLWPAPLPLGIRWKDGLSSRTVRDALGHAGAHAHRGVSPPNELAPLPPALAPPGDWLWQAPTPGALWAPTPEISSGRVLLCQSVSTLRRGSLERSRGSGTGRRSRSHWLKRARPSSLGRLRAARDAG